MANNSFENDTKQDQIIPKNEFVNILEIPRYNPGFVLRTEEFYNNLTVDYKAECSNENKEIVNYICKTCARSASWKNTLMAYNIEFPLQCDFCNKNFETREDLLAHTKFHTAKCSVCQKRFSWIPLTDDANGKPFTYTICMFPESNNYNLSLDFDEVRPNFSTNNPEEKLKPMDEPKPSSNKNHTDTQPQYDDVDLIFQGYAANVRKLSPRRQILVKFKIAKLLMEEELQEDAVQNMSRGSLV